MATPVCSDAALLDPTMILRRAQACLDNRDASERVLRTPLISTLVRPEQFARDCAKVNATGAEESDGGVSTN